MLFRSANVRKYYIVLRCVKMQDVVAYCKIDNINECASSPCVNGDCEDGIDMFKCICSDGFFGDLCQS